MLISEMSRRDCDEFLGRVGFGRLACVRDGQPYIVPIYFAAEPGRLFGFATMGQKIDWMRSSPRVCVEADEVLGQTGWTSVVVQGRYEEFPDTPEYARLRQEAQSRLEKVRSLWWQSGFAAAQTRRQVDRDRTVFYCIHVEEITGRRASPDPAE
jgi:uncharacterized protein